MQYLFVQFWPWLLVALVLGLVFSFLPREATKERAPLPLIAFGAVVVAALLGFALARALGGRLGLSIEAALLMIASYLAGSVIGALVGGAAPVRMRAWWFGVPLLLLLWISGNFLKNAAIEGDVRARVAAMVQKAGGDPLGLDVVGRDVLLPMDAATAAQRAQLSTVIRDVAGVRLVAEVPKLTGAAAEAFARAQAAREAAAKAAAEKAAAEKAAAERAAAEKAAAEKAAAERAAAEKAAAERAAAERAAAERAAAEKAAAERAAAEKAAADRAAAEKEAAEKAAADKAAADKAAADQAAAERAAAEKAAADKAAAEKATAERAAAEKAAAERAAAERAAAERVAAERTAAERAAAEKAAAERAAAERAAAERAAAERLAAEKAAADKAAAEKAAADKANAEAAARAAAQRAAAAPVAPNVQGNVQGDVQRCKANLAALIPPDKILFRLGSINLSPEATDVLKKAVTLLAQCPALSVRVAGHADRSGSRTANKWLSRRRARAVYYYLRNAGVKEDQLTLTGYGSSKPIASDTAHSDRNRRVELVVR